MHVEKNVSDNFVGTILNVSGKTKDNLKSRLDLKDMNIRHDLHPKILPNNKTHLPLACYTMSMEEKVIFLTVLKNLKVPDGYASNISRCVNLKERTLSNLKSHDGHILMQEILPIALRASMSGEVVSIVIELSSIFKALCSKTIDPQELDQLESRIALTLCRMEKIFPPSFFTIMVHLIIHLVHEIKLGGPVQYRWMYPIERYLMRLKSYVRNKAQPEGSIAEGYLAEECLTFCSRYLEDVETKWKNFRFELKAKYMLDDLTEPQLASNVPHGIVPHQWVDLVRYWFSEKCQLYSQIGKASRSLHTTHHTTGSRSFARKRDEFEIEHGREPSRLEFFIETHKRKDGTFDKPSQTIVDNVAIKIVEKGGTSELSEATSHLQDEAYTDILGKDRYGRVRGYGIGVTPTQLFGVEAYIRKMGCGGVDSMEMQRFQDQMKSTLKAYEEQMQTMQINYESQIQTMQKNHEEQMEAMHNSCEAKLAGIQSQLDQVTFMLLRFSGSFNNPIAGLAHSSTFSDQ